MFINIQACIKKIYNLWIFQDVDWLTAIIFFKKMCRHAIYYFE